MHPTHKNIPSIRLINTGNQRKDEGIGMEDIFGIIIYKIFYSIVWFVVNIVNMIREEYSVRRKKVTAKKANIQPLKNHKSKPQNSNEFPC